MRTTAVVLLALLMAGCGGSTPIVDRVESARISDDGARITVTVLHGRCEEGTRALTVQESDEQVRVRVDGARSASGACADIGVVEQLSARLSRPLGERVVVDDGYDTPVPVEPG